MQKQLWKLILITGVFSAAPAFADPVCGTLTKVSVTAGAANSIGYGTISFTLSNGQTYTPSVEYSWTSNGTIMYADPAVTAGMVAMLSSAYLSKAQVCYDTVTYTLSFN